MERQRLYFSQLSIIFLGFYVGLTGTCEIFPAVDPESYETEYAEISDDTARPLGFHKYVVRYTIPPKSVCLSVTGAEGRAVEVMFETDPPAYLCFKDQDGIVKCGQDNFYNCAAATADTMNYEFFYQTAAGSSESDIKFWLRITVGTYADDPEIMWCHEDRDPSFPSSLLGQGIRIPPPPPTEGPPSGSAPETTHGVLALVLFSIAIVQSLVKLM